MPPADGTKTGTKKRLIALGYRTLAIRTSPVGALTPDSVSVKVPPARKGSVSVSGGRGPANRRGLESESAWRPLPTQRPPGGLQHSALETFRSTCPPRGKPCGGVPGARMRPLRGLGLRRVPPCRGCRRCRTGTRLCRDWRVPAMPCRRSPRIDLRRSRSRSR